MEANRKLPTRPTRRRWLVGLLLGALAGLMPASAGAQPNPLQDPFDGQTRGLRDAVVNGWKRVDAARLDEMRGGFSIAMNDLNVTLKFGFSQAVLVNGELVARTELNLEQLRGQIAAQVQASVGQFDSETLRAQIQADVAAKLQQAGLTAHINVPPASQAVTAEAPAVAAATPLAANPAPGAVSAAPTVTPPASASATVTTPAPATAVGTGNGSQTATASPGTAASVTSLVVPVAVVQNGTRNQVSAEVGVVTHNAVTTIVQNSLDNQNIQVLTQLDATVNSAKLLQALEFRNTLREGIIRSLRR